MNKIANISEVTNGAERIIEAGVPYSVTVKIEGAADFLFHRWNAEAVDAKAAAAKGSKAKKTDDVESRRVSADEHHHGGQVSPGSAQPAQERDGPLQGVSRAANQPSEPWHEGLGL
jgi:hypothetical protein